MIKAAIWYKRRGLSVFPVGSKKNALVKWKRYQAESAGEKQLRDWFARWPDANIAAACGKVSDLTVVDCDSAKAIESVENLLPEGLVLPMVRTPSGGRHYHFTHQEGLRNWVGALPGVDVRTSGGMAIMPPSKNYRWLEGRAIHQVERPPMPAALLNAILDAVKKPDSESTKTMADPGIYGAAALASELAELAQVTKGERNSRLNRSAYSLGQLVAGGEIDAGQVERALLSMAISIGLGTDEAKNTIKSGMGAGSTRPRKARTSVKNNMRGPHNAGGKKKYASVRFKRPA